MTYRRYAAERTIASIGVFVAALVLIFLMFRVWGRPPGPDEISDDFAYLREFWNGTFFDRAWEFVSQYGQGSLGRSSRGESVTAPLWKASLVSLSLVIGALVVGLAIGIPLAVAWTRARRRQGLRIAALLAAGVFPVWSGLSLGLALGSHAELFPTGGYCDFFSPKEGCSGPADWAWTLALPWLSLGLWFAALYAFAFRALLQGHDRAVREAKDSERPAVLARGRRLLRIAIAKRLGRDVGFGLGAAAVIEILFSLPGLGRAFLRGLAGPFEVPTTEGALVLATTLALGIDLLVNLVGAAVDSEWREA